jgi:integrase/recombinase XerD
MHQYLNSVRALDPYLKKLQLSEIVGSVLKGFMADRRKVVSDPSVRRDLATGSSIFSTAQATLPRQVPEANPFRLLSKRHLKEVKRRRYLTPDEYTRIESALTLEWHRVALEVFVYTGMRHGEVRAFKKDWIHWGASEHGEIHLPQELTKTNEPRVLPMFPKLKGTLEGWCARHPGDYVFSHWSQPDQEYIPFASFQPFWTRVKLRAGVKDVRIHDLRHTFASWWIQKGGDMMALKDMLGHADLRMTERYAHLNSEAQHRAIREVGDLM